MSPRARPLPPDERRAAIVAAARPLIAQHGAQVTTAQIAEACGIAEGTLFRVFATKGEIIAAVIRESLDTAPLVAWVATRDEPTLAALVRALVVELQRRYREASVMFAALYTVGSDGGSCPRPFHDHTDARAQHRRLHDAVTAALARFAGELSHSPGKAASLLLGLATISTHGLLADGSLSDPDELVDLLLHGITKDTP